jgi:hypothetical protein
MTIKGQPSTGRFQLSLQQQWAFALTYAERQSFKAVSGVPTSDSDVDMLPPAEGGAKEQVDPLARTATEAEYKALKSGWWKWAAPDDSLTPEEMAELFMGWVCRNVDGLEGFIKEESPHTFFTVRQIVDLWAIINKDREGKADVNTEPQEGKK